MLVWPASVTMVTVSWAMAKTFAEMRTVLATVREQFDFVVVDSPPVLAVTDAVVIAREADGVVLVMKGQNSPRELVRRARDQLVQTGATILGAVVNDVDAHWGNFAVYHNYDGYRRPQSPSVREQRA